MNHITFPQTRTLINGTPTPARGARKQRMKQRTPKPTPLPIEPSDPILCAIAQIDFTCKEERRNVISGNCERALRQVRNHICSIVGAKAEAITERHVATFVANCDGWVYYYEHMHNIGPAVMEEMREWAAGIISQSK